MSTPTLDARRSAEYYTFAGKDVPWLAKLWAEQTPDKEFLIWEPKDGKTRSWTYAQFWQEINQGELRGRRLVNQMIVQVGVLAQRQADVLQHRERAEQAPVLKHDTPALAQRECRLIREILQVNTEDPDRA